MALAVCDIFNETICFKTCVLRTNTCHVLHLKKKKKKEEEKETILAADSQYSFSVSYIGFLVLKAGSSVLIFD